MMFLLVVWCLAASCAAQSEMLDHDVILSHESNGFELEMVEDDGFEINGTVGKGRANWPNLFTFFENKCKPSNEMKEKYDKTLQSLKNIQKVCRIQVVDRVNTFLNCKKEHEATEIEKKNLKINLGTCSGKRKELESTLPKERAITAKCRSTHDYLSSQLSDLREAFGVVVADNRVLVRDLELCDENEEHCTENLEECKYRCPHTHSHSHSHSHSSSEDSSSSRSSSHRMDRNRLENVPWGATSPYESYKQGKKNSNRKKP